jgi:hypothetical protein
MDLTIDAEESRVLRRVLDHYLREIREEIGKTENFDYRQGLKQDEEILKALIARVEPEPT